MGNNGQCQLKELYVYTYVWVCSTRVTYVYYIHY